MSQEEKEKPALSPQEEAWYDAWVKRRSKWYEWESPVGLSLGWALFIIPLGVFIELLHLAGVVK